MGCSNSKIEAPVVASDVVMYDVPTTPPPSAPAPGDAAISFAGNLGTYGKCKFKGKVAAKYLKTVGLSADAMDGPWNKTEAVADKVAAAMLKWAQDQGEPPRPLRCCHRAQNACLLAQGRTRPDTVALVRAARRSPSPRPGCEPRPAPSRPRVTFPVLRARGRRPRSAGATMATHVFQPLGSTGMRLGQVGQVHNAMFNFNKAGELEWVFDGGSLLKGETDGSSYMNGGMRVTHTAGGYTAIDPTSPVFIRGDTMYIPTVFVSWHGDALDEKTPLLRSMKAVNEQGKRLCSLMGYSVSGVVPNIGLEQEFFLIPRSAYYKRPDLQLCGRTIMGRGAPRGQEL